MGGTGTPAGLPRAKQDFYYQGRGGKLGQYDRVGGEVGGGDAAVVGEVRTLLRAWVVPMPR